jgi:hypothetical protein
MVRETSRGSAITSATSATTPSFQDRRVITPRTLNSLRLTFNRSFPQFFPENYRTDVGSLWGVNWLNLPPWRFRLPANQCLGLLAGRRSDPVAHCPSYRYVSVDREPLDPTRASRPQGRRRDPLSASPARWTISRPVHAVSLRVHALQPMRAVSLHHAGAEAGRLPQPHVGELPVRRARLPVFRLNRILPVPRRWGLSDDGRGQRGFTTAQRVTSDERLGFMLSLRRESMNRAGTGSR